MLKQSLVQEKLSDLMNSSSCEKGNSAVSIKLDKSKTNVDLVHSQYNMPQWPRVQLDKQNTSNLKRNTKIINNTSSTYEPSIQNLTNNRYPSAKSMKNNQEVNQKDLANTDNIAFDGDETVNFYSKVNYGRSDSPNSNKNLNKMNLNSTPYSEDSNNSNSKTGDTNKSELNRKNSSSNRDSYDLTMRLRYLEKSIKFIQQQHNETLNSLHQEIEKLKNENRELHFKLATRKSSSTSLTRSMSRPELERTRSSLSTKITNLNENSDLKDPLLSKGFEKAMKDSNKETDLDKRLNNIKSSYDTNKYDELNTRLNDAESKNEYLSKIIAQLQNKRTAVNSGFRPSSNNNPINQAANVNTNSSITKLNLNNIYTVEPLRIKLNESDEPRPPTLEESEIFISKLYDLYKHQKQQISNMKVVLKDVMQTENLSNQGMMMTKDVLENNSTKFSQYLLDNSNGFQKLSIVTPITRCVPQSGLSNRRYHSQFLATLASTNTQFNPMEVAASLQSANAVSNIHLPPLQTINPAKFPDRQRRTQVLQKQRLRRDYFH